MLPFVGLAVAAVAFIIVFWEGGTFEHETLSFFSHYLSERSVFQEVFDPHANDFGTYQARELSYFADWLDANIYQSIIARFAPTLFVPPSALVLPLLLTIVFALGVQRTAPHVDRVTAVLLLACLFSSFVFVSTLSLFYRSGKPLLSLVMLAFLFHVRGVDQRVAAGASEARRLFGRETLLAFALALLGGLFDLQGVFYLATACGVLTVHWVFTRRLLNVLLMAGAAFVALQLYNRVLGPRLIHTFNGYWPNFFYQKVPTHALPVHPAVELLSSNVSVMLGGFLPVTLAGAVAMIAGLWFTRERGAVASATDRLLRPLAYAILVGAANVVMFTLMVARHPAIYQMADHRHWYYPLPWLVLVLFGLVVGLNAVLARASRVGRRSVQLILAVLVVGNLTSLSRYREMMLQGPWFGLVHPQSQRLKTYLRTGIEDPLLAQNFRDHGARVRAALGETQPAR